MNAAGGGSPTGFLAKIVDRAHGDAAGVAPRLPGLFEPVYARRPSTSMPADGLSTGAPDTESQVASQPFAEVPTPSRPAQLREETAVRPGRRTRNRKSESENIAPRSERESFVAKASSPVAAAGHVARTPVVTPTVADLRPRATLVAVEPEAPAAASSNGKSRRERLHGDTDDPTAQRARAPNAPATQPPPSQQTLAQSVLVPKFVPFEAPRASSLADGERRQAGSAPARAEPSIQISIGRIEVRAPAQSPAPVQRAQRTQRPMSLDEYLERKERAR